MTAALLPSGMQQFVDANGVPYAGGSVAFYIPGTLTPKTTWQDVNQTVPNPNPVPLDSAGRCVVYGIGTYRQILKDYLGNTIWDQPTSATFSGTAAIDLSNVSAASFVSAGVCIDARAYGCRCDGTTDDTAAFQALINSLPQSAQTAAIYIQGQLRLTGPITSSGRSITINGDGHLASEILFDAAGVQFSFNFPPTTDSRYIYGLSMRDIRIKQTGATTSANMTDALNLSWNYNNTFEATYDHVRLTNVVIEGVAGYFRSFLKMTDGGGAVLTSCKFSNIGLNVNLGATAAVWLNRVNSTHLNRVYCTGCYFERTQRALYATQQASAYAGSIEGFYFASGEIVGVATAFEHDGVDANHTFNGFQIVAADIDTVNRVANMGWASNVDIGFSFITLSDNGGTYDGSPWFTWTHTDGLYVGFNTIQGIPTHQGTAKAILFGSQANNVWFRNNLFGFLNVGVDMSAWNAPTGNPVNDIYNDNNWESVNTILVGPSANGTTYASQNYQCIFSAASFNSTKQQIGFAWLGDVVGARWLSSTGNDNLSFGVDNNSAGAGFGNVAYNNETFYYTFRITYHGYAVNRRAKRARDRRPMGDHLSRGWTAA